MAYSTPCAKRQSPYSELSSTFQARPAYLRESCTQLLCKSFFFLIFLVVLPLFPSEAPEFVNQILLTKFWELFHLMFVGIAVSYGLFSRRNVQVGESDTHSNFQNQQSCLSKMFQVTSIFDNVEDLMMHDERKINKFWYIGESIDDFCNFNSQSSEQKKPHCFRPVQRYRSSYELADTDVGHACKFRRTQSETMVAVSEANNCSGEWGVPGTVYHKPLGLPVRSLRSNLMEAEDIELDWGSHSSSGSKNSPGKTEFRYNRCLNLEQRIDENVTSSSAFQWRSKSGKNAAHSSHFRPLSNDETQFESLKRSMSLHSTTSHSSETSSSSSSLTTNHSKMPSVGSISSKSSHSRQYRVSPLSEDSRGCSDDPLTDRENPSKCNLSVMSFPHLDWNFASVPKISSRGKSVRTVRANAVTTEDTKVQETNRNKVDSNVGKKFEEGGASYRREVEKEFGWPCFVNHSNQNSSRLLKMKFSEILLADTEANSEIEGDNIQATSDEEAESGAHEVDKKAGEFIAKFRQQIQLQKMASIET